MTQLPSIHSRPQPARFDISTEKYYKDEDEDDNEDKNEDEDGVDRHDQDDQKVCAA